MENYEPLSFLFRIEKCLNIHRDFLYLSRRKRVFITFIFLIEIIIYVFIWIDYISINAVIFQTHTIFYNILLLSTLLSSLQNITLFLYFAPRFGSEFRLILTYFSNCHDIINFNLPYQKFITQIKFKCRLMIVIYAVLRLIVTIIVVCVTAHDYQNVEEFSWLSLILYFTSEVWLEARYMTEILLFYCLLAIIRSVLQAASVLIRDIDYGSFEQNLNDSAKVYRLLMESVRQLKNTFSHYILLILFTAGANFISFAYRGIHLLLTDGQLWFLKRPNLMWHSLIYCIIYVTVAKSGQDMRNEVSKLLQTLAKIRSKYSIDDTPVNQGIKDLQRLVSVRPLTIELLPTLRVGMYLLPAILSLIVNYIIVTLQMNHDI